MEIMDPLPAVLAVAAVFGLALWWLGRKGVVRLRRAPFHRRPRRLESIERLTLAPHHFLYLVQVDGSTVVMAQSPSGLTVIETAASSSGAPAAKVGAARAAAAER